MKHLPNSVKVYLAAVSRYLQIFPDFYIFLAVSLVLLPLQWLGAWLLALVIHELCHYICLKVCGVRVYSVAVSCKGIFMRTDSISYGKEALCAYAGPIGALLVLLFARYVPRTAICTLLLSSYNLLPLYPMDGGRGLHSVLRKLFAEETADRIEGYTETAVLIVICGAAVYAVAKLGLGLLPAAVALMLLWRNGKIKFPCKNRRLGVQ